MSPAEVGRPTRRRPVVRHRVSLIASMGVWWAPSGASHTVPLGTRRKASRNPRVRCLYSRRRARLAARAPVGDALRPARAAHADRAAAAAARLPAAFVDPARAAGWQVPRGDVATGRSIGARYRAATARRTAPARKLQRFACNLEKAFDGFEADFFQQNLRRIVDDVVNDIRGQWNCGPRWSKSVTFASTVVTCRRPGSAITRGTEPGDGDLRYRRLHPHRVSLCSPRRTRGRKRGFLPGESLARVLLSPRRHPPRRNVCVVAGRPPAGATNRHRKMSEMTGPSLRLWSVDEMPSNGRATCPPAPSIPAGHPQPDGCFGEAPDPGPLTNDPTAVDVRLSDAAETGTVLELIVVLRGTVHPWGGPRQGLWRVRLPDGHHRLFSAEAVLAATPVKKPSAPAQRRARHPNRPMR